MAGIGEAECELCGKCEYKGDMSCCARVWLLHLRLRGACTRNEICLHMYFVYQKSERAIQTSACHPETVDI